MAGDQPRPGEDFLGKYRILRVVGEGGMGLVYSAHHLLLDTPIAIKVLSREVSRNPDHVTRFLNEARLAARIKSPHVCSVMDIGQLTDGRPFFVMELLEGGDVAAALNARGPLPIWDIVDIAMGALEGLVHAHVRGIVHRDLKPSNLFLATEAGGQVVVKVLDFGISKFEGMEEAPTAPDGEPMLLGSPAYMSPEQARDARNVDVRSDIWSLGVILYELATGVCPFHGPSQQETLARIRSGAMPPPAGKVREMPAVLEAAIARCMRRNPDERFPNVLELAQAIAPMRPGADAAVARIAAVMARPRSSLGEASTGAALLESPPPHPTNVSWVHAPASRRTSRRAMGVGVAAGLALLGAFGVFMALQKRPKPVAAAPAPVGAAEVLPAVTATFPAAAALPVSSSAPAAASAPAPVPASSAPAPSDADPDPTAAVSSASPAHTPGRPAPHLRQPSKQELLKERR